MDGQFSYLTQSELSSLCIKYDIGSEFQAKVPDRNQPINRPHRGMAGVYESHFAQGNLRLPLRPFFRQILDHYQVHICQLTPFAVSKIVSFEMLCNALSISPTIPLFRHFFYLFPSEKEWFNVTSHHGRKLMTTGKAVRGWKNKFFFVDVKHEMVMRTLSKIDPEIRSHDENDAELLSRYMFHVQPLPREMLSLDVKAAQLLMSNKYIEKKSMEVMEETERNVGEEETGPSLVDAGQMLESDVHQSNAVMEETERNVVVEETGPFLIDGDSAGQMMRNVVRDPCENQGNCELLDYLDLLSYEQLENDLKELDDDERIAQEQGLQTHLIDEDSAGQMIETHVMKHDILESLELELLGNYVEDPCDERNVQGVETHMKALQRVICAEHACEPENDVLKNECLHIIRNDIPSKISELSDVVPTVKKEQGGGGDFGDLIRDCDHLTKQKKGFQDEWLHQQCLVNEKKEEYERKLSEVMALKLRLELESTAHLANLEESEAKKHYFHYQISTLKKKHEEILTLCHNLVKDIQSRILFEKKEFKEKLSSLCNAFKASEDKWKACEEERLRLAQDRSWLIEEGIKLVTERLMNSQEFCDGLSPIIEAAVNLGIAQGKVGNHDQSSNDELQSNVKQAVEKISETILRFQELKWSYLKAVATNDNQSLEDLKNTIPKQTPEGGKKFIEHLCDQLSSDVWLS